MLLFFPKFCDKFCFIGGWFVFAGNLSLFGDNFYLLCLSYKFVYGFNCFYFYFFYFYFFNAIFFNYFYSYSFLAYSNYFSIDNFICSVLIYKTLIITIGVLTFHPFKFVLKDFFIIIFLQNL